MKGNQARTYEIMDEKVDLVTDSHGSFTNWKTHFRIYSMFVALMPLSLRGLLKT